MTDSNQSTGKLGEKIAVEHLLHNGYVIVKTNFHCHWGEIDIIAKKNSKISFVEVKARKSDNFGKPHEAVNLAKIKKLMRPINFFLLKNNYKQYKLSLDVISILLKTDGSVGRLKHFENITN